MLYSLLHINEISPYRVIEYEENTACFITDSGVAYMVGFIQDTNLGIPNVYQLFITPRSRNKVVGTDAKIGRTVSAIVQSFFNNHENVLVYICDTSDRQHAARNRKFKRWFELYAEPDMFDFVSEEIQVSDDEYFAAMILKRSHPQCQQIIDTFHDYFHYLREKLD